MENRPVYAWIVNHDDRWLFTFFYIGLAVVLSIWISLFWLVALVGVHFLFELVRHSRHRTGLSGILLEALWGVKLDVALVLFALVLSLYMEIALGVVGLSSATRAGAVTARSGIRFAGWQRLLRGFFLIIDDLAQVARVVGRRRTKPIEPKPNPESLFTSSEPVGPAGSISSLNSWTESWSRGDWVAIGLGAICCGLIIAAPWLTNRTLISVVQTLAMELHPFPGP